MDAGIDLGMPLNRLGHAPEPVQLREEARQGPALPQDLKEARGPGLGQGLVQFLPDPFRHQGVHLPGGDHGAHQVQGLVGDLEAQIGVAGGEPRHAQDADRVLGEGLGHMPQPAGREIPQATVVVDDAARLVLRQGIDGQVTAAQVLLQGYVRFGMDHEAPITRQGLALGARQGVFVLGLGMQEDGEIHPDLTESQVQQLLGGGANHHEITLRRRPPQKPIADRAADEIGLDARKHISVLAFGPFQPGWPAGWLGWRRRRRRGPSPE